MNRTPLERLIRERIAAAGPISLAEYMTLALGAPEHGYYSKSAAIGADGDFITAPEISQMFGELIGAWALDFWQNAMGGAPLTLVECGPGRGTLMADMLRTMRLVPAAQEGLSVHLIETNQTLIAAQRDRLAGYGIPVSWHSTLASLPDRPVILVANEFLDALPIRQFIRKNTGWHEVMVGLTENRFGFVTAPFSVDPKLIPPALADAEDGTVCEISPATEQAVATIASHCVRHGSAALIIDYGPWRTGPGDSFQAVFRHAYADPLTRPGDTDLTAHVDFQAVREVALSTGAAVHGPVTQGDFLTQLGLRQRAEILKRKGDGAAIDAAVHRLCHADEMGHVFKAVAITAKNVPTLAGFHPAIHEGAP